MVSNIFAEASVAYMSECNLYNAACRSFANLSSFNVTEQAFNPDDPNSPMVRMYYLLPYKTVQLHLPPNPNNNMILNRMLDNPSKYTDLFINLYQNSQSLRPSSRGTRIEQLFQKMDLFYKKNFN